MLNATGVPPPPPPADSGVRARPAVPNHLDAEMLSAALRSEGIDSFIKLTDLSAGSWGDAPGLGGGPLEVWVNVDDLDRAQAVVGRRPK
jgi:hypothetical protein